MNKPVNNHQPFVSVIIPCYNHGRYLANAINSVFGQEDYNNYEIIVVDDGSSDDTKAVATSFFLVKYVYQKNAGLSAARNTGILHSIGEYILFLDADDWLLPKAMTINTSYLLNNDNIAFVSGAYEYLYERENQTLIVSKEVTKDHYLNLLEINYIGMHGTVLYQRWVFDFVTYDSSLKACEDYDLYLRIAREFPVMHHQHLIAVYRIHDRNMSGDIILMLASALQVLKKQEPFLRNEVERARYRQGISEWHNYYTSELYERLIHQLNSNQVNKLELAGLKKYNRALYKNFIARQRVKQIRMFIKRALPAFILKPFVKTGGSSV